MKCVQDPENGRNLRITEIPSDLDRWGNPTEFEIEINYLGPGNCEKGVMIDYIIIPLIVAAINTIPNSGLTRESMDALRQSVRRMRFPVIACVDSGNLGERP